MQVSAVYGEAVAVADGERKEAEKVKVHLCRGGRARACQCERGLLARSVRDAVTVGIHQDRHLQPVNCTDPLLVDREGAGGGARGRAARDGRAKGHVPCELPVPMGANHKGLVACRRHLLGS